MKRLLSIVLACTLPLVALAQPSPDKTTIAQSNNQFAIELYQQLKSKEGNLFFSPESISNALAMTYAGARGETSAEMANTLHFHMDADQLHAAMAGLISDLNTQGKANGYQLAVSNALWLQKGYILQNAFRALIENNYHGGLNEVDFLGNTEAARLSINQWVEDQTAGKIINLIAPGGVNQMTRLVLTNAVYFKGSWSIPFKKSATHDENFYPGAQLSHVASMMHRSDAFKYLDGGTFQALEIPYVKEDLSMVIFLPNNVDGIHALEEKMTPQHVSEWLNNLIYEPHVELSLPKFKLETGFELADTLKAMGMVDAFSDSADFSGMTGRRDLAISRVIHKAYADVNEEGTEAAAATAITMRSSAIVAHSAPPIVFRVDHPFIFLIRDNLSGSILFMGRVSDVK